MQWKPRKDLLIDVLRPVTRHRRWRFAMLEVDGSFYGEPFPFIGLREAIRRARAFHHRQGNAAAQVVVLLAQDFKPVTAGRVRRTVGLYCPEDGCGKLLIRVSRDLIETVAPSRPVREKRAWALATFRSGRPPAYEWPSLERLMQSAGYFTAQTVCPCCATRAAWDIPLITSFVRYRRAP